MSASAHDGRGTWGPAGSTGDTQRSPSFTPAGAVPGEGTEPARASAGPDAPGKAIEELIWDCERLGLYHAARQNWFETMHRTAMFLVVLAGSGAVAALAAELEAGWQATLGMVPVVVGLADLLLDFAGQARAHEGLYRRFTGLRGEILAGGQDPSRTGEWLAAIHRIHIDEPPTYPALDTWAHNRVCDSWDRRHGKLRLRFYHRTLKQICPFWSSEFPPVVPKQP